MHAAGISHAQRPIAESAAPANGKQVSTSDIQQVQNYIEKCLQMYLTQKEVRLAMLAEGVDHSCTQIKARA